MNQLIHENKVEIGIALGCLGVLAAGTLSHNVLAAGTAGVVLCFLLYRGIMRVRLRRLQRIIHSEKVDVPPITAPAEPSGKPAPRRKKSKRKRSDEIRNADEFVEAMMQEGRYALLLRPEVVANLSDGQRAAALSALREEMTFIPAGRVLAYTEENQHKARLRKDAGSVSTTEHVFIDRYPITNGQFKQFVDGGGYEVEEYWDQGVFDGVDHFRDTTDEPGPRFWEHGEFPAGQADHPVVGISWYEANACARWLGKRLPESPEWVKACSWPVASPDGSIQQRKYPWGDSFGEGLANTWSAGIGRTVPVFEFDGGVSKTGGYQFIGNVWEWMADDLHISHASPDAAHGYHCKAIRGGAYDTYFSNQATCHFESGDELFARKPNIGFRCLVSADELATEVLQGVEHDHESTSPSELISASSN